MSFYKVKIQHEPLIVSGPILGGKATITPPQQGSLRSCSVIRISEFRTFLLDDTFIQRFYFRSTPFHFVLPPFDAHSLVWLGFYARLALGDYSPSTERMIMGYGCDPSMHRHTLWVCDFVSHMIKTSTSPFIFSYSLAREAGQDFSNILCKKFANLRPYITPQPIGKRRD